ncbi:MAG TPA: hypothetical protein ENK18_16145 [Deltaproteobacteria bacterium]|nr:hypothetical protein [Deltaproteobacteria bacterium]
MRHWKILACPLLSWALAACPGDGTTPPTPTTDTGTDPATEGMALVGVSSKLEFESRSGGEGFCPAIEGYSVGLLFDVDPVECLGGCPEGLPDAPARIETDGDTSYTGALEADLWPQMPERLARYCSYRHVDETVAPPDEVQGLAGSQRARMVAGPSASGLEPELVVRYEAEARQQIGLCDPTLDQPVRLTLLDTGATCPPGIRCSDAGAHGEPLADIIATTMCGGDPGCSVEIHQRVAMPLRAGPSWHIGDGGHFGSLDWLAQAIVREVRAWQAEGSGEPLILNLSLAWHPDYGGSGAAQELVDRDGGLVDRADVLAVYDALRYARCSGALTIAAVGNRSGIDDRGAMYPAAWAKHVISKDDCSADFGLAPELQPFGDETPLLYAAGGIDARNNPLGIGRLEATPNLVAYAQHVPGFSSGRSGGPLPLTGSSVAAALVSAAAAQVWSLHPTETADQVMQRVWTGGDTLAPDPSTAGSADLHLGAFEDPWPRRVAGCGDSTVVLPPSPLDAVEATSFSLIPGSDPFDRLYTSYSPFSFPTPETQECPVCGLDIDFVGELGQLYLSLATKPALEVRLALQDTAGGWSSVALGRVDGPDELTVPVPAAPERAVVLFKDEDEAWYRSEVHILGL